MATLNYVLRDPVTGVGIPEQAVKLRIGPGFATDTHTLTDVSGKPGAYQIVDMSAVAKGEYELWVNGVKDTSFGRREITKQSDILLISDGHWDAQMKELKYLANGTTPQSAYTKAQAEAAHYTKDAVDVLVEANVSKAGDDTITGLKLFEVLPKAVGPDADPEELPEPESDGDFIYLKYFNQILASLNTNSYNQSPREIIVYPGAPVVTGKLYADIKTAVAYAFSQTPGTSKQYAVFIKSMSGDSATINAAAGSLKSNVHLIALGNFISIIIMDNSLAANTKIENATLYFGAGVIATDREFNGLELINCDVFAYRNLTLNNGRSKDCKILTADGYKAIFKNACDVENTIVNVAPDFTTHSGAKLYDVVEDVYTLPADPTIPA